MRIVIFLVFLFFFLFSALVSWYEGSSLIGATREQQYTNFFSQLIYGENARSFEISQLDFFIYAAKYHPLFPTLMIVSFIGLTFTLYTGISKKKTNGILSLLTGLIFVIGSIMVLVFSNINSTLYSLVLFLASLLYFYNAYTSFLHQER